MDEGSPGDVETLLVRTLFELNARTIEMQRELRLIRRLLEDDGEDEEEEDPDGGIDA